MTEKGIVIGEVAVIDSVSGETLRVSKLTDELAAFIETIEIDIDAYFEVEQMKKTNPIFTKLINTFKLYT